MSDLKGKDYLLYVEDDPYLSEDMIYFISSEFAGLNVVHISNVSEFISHLDDFRASPPMAVILDIMMRIGDAKAKYPEIDYSELDGGLICMKLLQQYESTANVPIIVVSAKSQSLMKTKIDKFSQIVSYIEKPLDEKAINKILDVIRSIFAISGKSKYKKEGAMKKVWSAIEAKPGAFGVKIDVRKLLPKKKRS